MISFPFLVEPNLSSREQAWAWSGVFAVFVVLCVGVAFLRGENWRRRSPPRSNPLRAQPPPLVATLEAPSVPAAPDWRELLLWICLAACASVLLVSLTNHLSQNVAPIPLLWVIPLALYLMSFILCFESDKIYQRWLFVPLLAPLLGFMAFYIYSDSGNTHIKKIIPLYAAGLFVCCMVLHGELSKRKPSPRYLTLFYLMVSLGGALGGIVVAIVAPHVFHAYLELPIGLIACALLTVIALWEIDIPRLGPLAAASGAVRRAGRSFRLSWCGKKRRVERRLPPDGPQFLRRAESQR